jgi:glycine cleavage system H protein
MRKFTEDHEWVNIDGDIAYVGISRHAAEELGDITFVEPPEIGTDFIVGDVMAVVESVKAASDMYAPISGTVKEVNVALDDDPGLINSSPEENGWICKLENFDIVEMDALMDEEGYQQYLKDA